MILTLSLVIVTIALLSLLFFYIEDKYKKNGIKDSNRSHYNYRISYDKKERTIYLNDVFLLASLNLGSINHQMFAYLYQHPEKELTEEQFLKNTQIKSICSFSKKIDSIGLRGDVRKYFFRINKSSITFIPSVTLEQPLKLMLKGNID